MIVAILFFALYTPASFAENRADVAVIQKKINVAGKVLDASGQPIIGATVLIAGTTTGDITGANGTFNINNVDENAQIEASFMGYKSKTLKASENIIFTLADDAMVVDDVVVVGYGTQKKENLTGAVSMVSMDKVLGDRPVTSIGSALQGAIPGLVITGGAVPGVGQTFNIRGTTSINGGSPLILVDNVPAQINLINPEDIESVSVLKDAASASIYGARGAFGVILITTKKAKKNSRLQLNYNNNIGFSKSINRPVQASVEEILQTHLDFDNDGKYFAQSQDLKKWIGYVQDYNNGSLQSKYPNAYLKNGRFIPDGESVYYYLSDNDLTSEVIDKYGFQHTHNLSATGGSDKITYRLSMGYVDNDGVLVTSKDSYQRFNVGSYVSADITKWLSTAVDIRYARDDRSYVEDTEVYNTYFRRFYPTGSMPKSSDINGPEYIVGNPLNYMLNSDPVRYHNENPRIYSRTKLNPVKGLEGIFEYTYDGKTWDKKSYSNNFQIINDQMGVINRSNTPTYRNDKSAMRYNSLNAYASYDIATKNQNHNFKIMAGYSQERRYEESLWASRKEIINPSMPSISGSVGEILAGDSFTDYTIRSGYYRFNYNFKNKYLLEVNGRYDGSSKFPTDTRFGFFPSASVGWQVGKEKFMDWSNKWLQEFKIRGSWGQIGNQAIDNYLFLPEMSSYRANWIVDGQRPTSLNMPALVRSNFTWEVVENINIGVDMSLFNNRLQATFEWYQRDTKGMLAPGMELPAVVGASAPTQNSADLRNRGWEASVNWRDNVGEWSYSVGANIYDSRTKITKFNNEGGLLSARYVGQEIGEIWGYETDGFYTIDDFKDTWQNGKWELKDDVTKIRGNSNIRPGDIKFVNLRDDENSVNEIYAGNNTLDNPGDQKIIGNNTARYNFGINASVGWKGINLSVFLNGTGKRDAWLEGDLIWPLSKGTFGTVYYNQLDYWKPTDRAAGNYEPINPNPKFPRIYEESNASGSNYRKQTKYLSNAAYLRLKNLTLSYTLPKQIVNKVSLSAVKVFFSAENIATWHKLPKGYDPERLDWGYPFYATYSLGINITL